MDIAIHERASRAFIEALRRSEDMLFSRDEVNIS
jgi:hypothetical protein